RARTVGAMEGGESYGVVAQWEPETPKLRPFRLVLAWIVAAISIEVAAAIVPGVALDHTGAAFLGAAVVAIINAILPPLLAALRLPLAILSGFVAVLFADAAALKLAAAIAPSHIQVSTWGDALLAALLM